MTEEQNLVFPAPLSARLAAYIIDYSLLGFSLALLPHTVQSEVFGYFSHDYFSLSPIAVFLGAPIAALTTFLFISLLLSLYNFVFEASPLLSSPGKMIAGIEVRAIEGGGAPLIRIAIRNLSRFFCVLAMYLGYLIAAFNIERQGLHDMLARTIVVEKTGSTQQPKFLVIIFSILLFLTFCFFFDIQTKTGLETVPANSNTADKNEREASLTIEQTKKLPNFPVDSIGYLEYQEQKILFADFIIRQGVLRKGFAEVDGGFTQKLQRLEIAFYETELSSAQKEQGSQLSNLLQPRGPAIDLVPVAVLLLESREGIAACDPEDFTNAMLEFNKRMLPRLDQTLNERLVLSLDIEKLFENGQFSIECHDSEQGETLAVAIQALGQPSVNVPPLFFNVRLEGQIFQRMVSTKALYRGGDTSLAIWHEAEKKLEVAFYKESLDQNEKRQVFSAPSLSTASRKPESIATFIFSDVDTFFVRDQIKSFSITFNKQSEGPLNFIDGREKFTKNFSAPQLPTKLAGRKRNNERLIGRLEGEATIETKTTRQHFEWALPFNAQLLIKESE